jgi:ATP-dependent helicase/nuclease subunit A
MTPTNSELEPREFLPEDRLAREQAADPRFNVALEASAGTGKTRVLVDRYIRLIEEGANPRHILAITFTRKATGEMKSRIIEELRRTTPLWEEVRDRLFDIHIATIDAFCLGLLKEFPLEAGLDPDIDLLDEVDTQGLAEIAVDETLADRTHAPRQLGPDIGFLTSVFGEPALRRSLRDLLRSRLVKEDMLHRFVDRYVPRELALDTSLRQVVEGLRGALDGEAGVEELLTTGPEPSLPRWRALSFAFRRAVDPEHATPMDVELVASYFLTQAGHRPRKRLARLFTTQDFPNRSTYQQHRDTVLALAPAVAEVYARWFGDRDLYGVRELWRLYRETSRRFQALKESRRGLDFTDVLLSAVRLLERRDEFSQSRFRLESRYHHLLIDEFQDTNDVQWRLVQALIDSWGEGSGLVQEAILAEQASGRGSGVLREPTIFIVGDRKQSIYGWRDARVEVMERAARQLLRLRPDGGKRLTIRQSFRAPGTLLDFLNDVFAGVPQIGQELEWSFRYRDSDHFPILEKKTEEHPVGLAAEEDLLRAAAAVADEVVRLLQVESYRPNDIAILFRSRTHYRAFEEALTDRGVPAYVYRGLGFFDSAEVKDIQALVRFLSEPGSELRAAELLRSRFIGLSDTGLALIAAGRHSRRREGPLARLLRGGTPDAELPLPLSADDQATAARAAATVPNWIRRADRLPPADLLVQILEETDYAGRLTGRKGQQGWENLKKILEMVRRAQNRGYLTLSRLGEYLDSASTGEESLAVLEAVDAVNLMTIHAAKGLEFECVFVVNMDQKTRSDVTLPRIKEKAGGNIEVHALGRPDDDGPGRTAEEEKRLLYVALTRARKRLVLSTSGLADSEGKTTFLQLLPESLRELLRQATTSEEPELTWVPSSSTHRLRLIRPAPTASHYQSTREEPPPRLLLEPLGESGAGRLAVAELARQQAGEEPSPWVSDPVELAVGIAVHRMFEYEVPPDEPTTLVERAEALLPELPDSTPAERAEGAKRAAEFYQRLSQQSGLKALLSRGEVHHEVPFALRRPGQVVRGAIDSLVLIDSRVVVIDYKTGAGRPEHRLQMELYLEAAQALFPGRDLEGLVFYPAGPPLTVKMPSPGGSAPSQLELF